MALVPDSYIKTSLVSGKGKEVIIFYILLLFTLLFISYKKYVFLMQKKELAVFGGISKCYGFTEAVGIFGRFLSIRKSVLDWETIVSRLFEGESLSSATKEQINSSLFYEIKLGEEEGNLEERLIQLYRIPGIKIGALKYYWGIFSEIMESISIKTKCNTIVFGIPLNTENTQIGIWKYEENTWKNISCSSEWYQKLLGKFLFMSKIPYWVKTEYTGSFNAGHKGEVKVTCTFNPNLQETLVLKRQSIPHNKHL